MMIYQGLATLDQGFEHYQRDVERKKALLALSEKRPRKNRCFLATGSGKEQERCMARSWNCTLSSICQEFSIERQL